MKSFRYPLFGFDANVHVFARGFKLIELASINLHRCNSNSTKMQAYIHILPLHLFETFDDYVAL
jgi:hypothetical protein